METHVCGISRSSGRVNVEHRTSTRNGNATSRKRTIALVLAALIVVGLAPAARADLPAPAFMPNSPLLAGTQVIILWLPVPGAVRYNIYLNDNKIGESPSIQFIVASPEASGEYRVQLTAVDSAGKESPKSAPGVFKIVTVEPPKGLIHRVTEGKVLLRWDKAKGAVIYNVYRSEKKDGDYALLASVQGEDHTDATGVKGKVYYYTVASKDLAGKESKRSDKVMASLVEAVAAKEAVKINLKVVPSKEIEHIIFTGKNKLSMYGDFKIAPNGFGYIVDSGESRVLKIDLAAGDVVKAFGEAGAGEGKLQRPTKLAFTKDGRIFLGDLAGKILVYDANENFQREFKIPVPDKVKDKDVYENAMDATKGAIPMPNGLLVDELTDTLYVASATYNTIITFTLDGKFKGFIGRGGKGDGLILAAPTELFFTPDRSALVVTEPPAHAAAIIDLKEMKRKDTIGTRRSGFIGSFIGINGATVTPQGNLLFCDSGIHSIQVFDGKTHDYLYHIGSEEPAADPEFKERAKFDFQLPVGGNFDASGKLYIVNGGRRSISVREVMWDKLKDIK